MTVNAKDIFKTIEEIRAKAPVVHNITNYVAMNNSANALLAIGASPVMAHAEEEMEEMVGIAGAVVINIGTLSEAWISAMFEAAHQARIRGIPIVLDPVGAGATSYRTQTAKELISSEPPRVIRGNASEIMALFDEKTKSKGVDSAASSHDAVAIAKKISADNNCVVCVSGQTDFVVDGDKVIKIHNGHSLMTRVTGLGCTASALCGAFAAVEKDAHVAVAQAMAVMGIAGEIAAEKATGPGSLQVHFLDALYNLKDEEIARYLKFEE